MSDRFTPDDLHNKGFEADGNGGFRKVRKAAEPAVKDISGELEELYPNKKITPPVENAKIKGATKVEQGGVNTIKIKPLTQNRAWKGRRFKSDQYKTYAMAVTLLLPNNLIVPDGLLRVYYEFGMSTNSDFDNPCKMFTDILQKKYDFNDSRIMEAYIRKVIVKKGEEYITFKIESYV